MEKFQIGIVKREYGFPRYWIKYCQEKGISYKLINCYDSDIISQLWSVDALLWNWDHESPEDTLIARNIIYAAELMGLKVFPDTVTCWSFDDKLAQKYILEAIGAPLVPAYVFFDKGSAMNWVSQTSFPKVFKLRKGAGSKNVILVRSARKARALVRQAFGRGFKPAGRFVRDVVERFAIGSRQQRLEILGKIKRIPERLRTVYKMNKQMGRECGCIYFQDFISDNQFDTRITVLGDRYAFGFTRDVRKNDFRASGSGSINYNLDKINLKCVNIAFEVARKLGTQSIAFDFVMDANAEPLITEINYGYFASAVYNCPGYWDDQLQWHEGHVWPTDIMLIDIIEQLRQAKKQAGI